MVVCVLGLRRLRHVLGLDLGLDRGGQCVALAGEWQLCTLARLASRWFNCRSSVSEQAERISQPVVPRATLVFGLLVGATIDGQSSVLPLSRVMHLVSGLRG